MAACEGESQYGLDTWCFDKKGAVKEEVGLMGNQCLTAAL